MFKDTKKKSILDLLFLKLPQGAYEKSILSGNRALKGSVSSKRLQISRIFLEWARLGSSAMFITSGFSRTGRQLTVQLKSPPRITGSPENLFNPV
jgi:hypothetical protein